MTNTTTATREVKLKTNYSNPLNTGKEYSVDELFLLQQVFGQIEKCNLKRSANVDYWLVKNEKLLTEQWIKFKTAEKELYKKHAEVYLHPTLKGTDGEPETFFHLIGDDNSSDKILLNDFGFFKLIEGEDVKLEPVKDSWTMTIPATEEGKEPTYQEIPYKYKFKSDEHRDLFTKEFDELKEAKYHLDLYRLKEEHLEGLSIVWKDIEKQPDGRAVVKNDLTQFRDLLYDNCIA